MRSPFVPVLLLASSLARAHGAADDCDREVNTVEALGWTEDSASFVWKTTHVEDGETTEVVHVTSTGSAPMQFATRLPRMIHSIPLNHKSGEDWAKWKATHKLAKLSTGVVSPTDKTSSLKVLLGDKPLTPRGNEFVDAKPATPPTPFVLSVTSSHALDPRTWKSDATFPGCARVHGYWSPDGSVVAWLTGTAKETCAGDTRCTPPYCCQGPQVLLLRTN